MPTPVNSITIEVNFGVEHEDLLVTGEALIVFEITKVKMRENYYGRVKVEKGYIIGCSIHFATTKQFDSAPQYSSACSYFVVCWCRDLYAIFDPF